MDTHNLPSRVRAVVMVTVPELQRVESRNSESLSFELGKATAQYIVTPDIASAIRVF